MKGKCDSYACYSRGKNVSKSSAEESSTNTALSALINNKTATEDQLHIRRSDHGAEKKVIKSVAVPTNTSFVL